MTEQFELQFDEAKPLPGFRLKRFEVYNWGTFDGVVYTAQPDGQSTLLVGENGSGKSTLVDAILTLLVRPQTRNYNVAAGATRKERDERTYIRGAYDRSVGESGRPEIQYLRDGQSHFTAILGTFSNANTGSEFTLLQVLHLNHENQVEKVYAMSEGQRGIVHDLGQLKSVLGIPKHLREIGYRTTDSYKEYFQWLQKLTNFRSKAMDVFNQTVAVKDVQRLDLFIRDHMLERKPWMDRVKNLLSHFNELSETHRVLVRIRMQDEMLKPIIDAGERFTAKSFEWEDAKAVLVASDAYFAIQTIELLRPHCSQWQLRIDHLSEEVKRLEQVQERLRVDAARIDLEIESAGGERLRMLPKLIEQAVAMASVKHGNRKQFESLLALASLEFKLTSPEQFLKLRPMILHRREEVVRERDALRAQYNQLQIQIGALMSQIHEETQEMESLSRRKGNMPEPMIRLRDSMCTALRLAPSDLPFAAELMAVLPAEREWEASIEQVLASFAKSLLVPDNLYGRVSGYIDRTRLTDPKGSGQRLVYLKVTAHNTQSGADSGSDYLPGKLEYHESHAISAWVRAYVRQRFEVLACETVEEFQKSKGAAMTKNRHSKSSSQRHEKDDRASMNDRRHFVLGWDNRAKLAALRDSVGNAKRDLEQLQSRSESINRSMDRCTAILENFEQALRFEDFDSINYEQHEFEASQLELEKEKIESSSDRIRFLRKKAEELRAEARGHQSDRDAAIAERARKEQELYSGSVSLKNAESSIERLRQSDQYSAMESRFSAIEESLTEKISFENLGVLPNAFRTVQTKLVDRMKERLVPLEREMASAMTRFLKKFPNEQDDLDSNVESLPTFQAMFERISKDDLPRHEERFKTRLTEKVLTEIGLFRSSLETECQEIRDKIEQLNSALRRLDWKPGTFMRLEPIDLPDREIQDFRKELTNCLSNTFSGTSEVNEATFVRIEKLMEKLRDENNLRWREKVIDVREWFTFAAQEVVAATGENRSYYDGGTGQSGGEKGKLAFLVLVAAIAYQYDLDPDSERSSRFHFVMVDEMFSRSDDAHAEYALDLFHRFGLQLLIVAPLDAKARVTEPYVGTYLHVIKNKETHRSQLVSVTAQQVREAVESV